MSWIESHQALERHPKTLKLTTEMGWSVDAAIGKLHRFWWWCVDYAENGDLSKYNDQVIGGGVGLAGDEAKKFVDAMITAIWIDRSPYLRVHDWWTYIGRFLQVKYKNYPEKWMEIKALYNNGKKNSPKNRFKGGFKPKLPNQPNIPNQPIYSEVDFALASLLKDKILTNNPKAQIKDGSLEKWAEVARIMIERDKRNEIEIKSVIEWSQNDEFWKMNILSMQKLREKFDQLWLKMKGDQSGKSKRSGFTKGDNTAGAVDSSKYDKAGIPD